MLGLSWEKNVSYKKACIPLNKVFGNIFFVCSTGVGDKGPKQRRAGAREAETNRITTRGQTHNHRQLMRHQESSKESFFGVCLQYFYTFSSAGWSLINETCIISRLTHSFGTNTCYTNPGWRYLEKNQTSRKYKREPFYSLRRCQLWFVFRRQRHNRLNLMSSTCRPYSGTKETK